jgi:hypothetical protein
MERIDRYSEYLTTYDQIMEAASLLTYLIENYREGRNDGTIKPEVAKSWIRFYDKALIRYLEFMSTVEIRLSDVKGFKKIFIYPNEHREIPYCTIYVRRKNMVPGEPGINYDRYESAISFEYYNKASMHFHRARNKPTLYDILEYIKSTFHIFDLDRTFMDTWISIDQLKRDYPENKETYKTSEKLQSIFSETEMLKIPIVLGCPFNDDYWEEISRLDDIENANSNSNDQNML